MKEALRYEVFSLFQLFVNTAYTVESLNFRLLTRYTERRLLGAPAVLKRSECLGRKYGSQVEHVWVGGGIGGKMFG